MAEWFLSETNLFLQENSLPFELEREPGATADDLIAWLDEGTPMVAVVSTPHLVHAVVIVGYHPTDGFAYLDSLRQGDDMPFAADFLADYGVPFLEAWTDTFILVEIHD